MNWIKLSRNERLKVLEEIKAHSGFPLYIIEKDWWVVQTLRLVSQMKIAEHIVFKGGTSLSKAWGLIDRFSEDIDLAINREFWGFYGEISRKQVGKLRDVSSKYISCDFLSLLRKAFADTEIRDVQLAVADMKNPDDDPVKIEVLYPTVTEYSAYIKPRVLLEIGSRSLIEPATLRSFRSMIGQEFFYMPFADKKVVIRCVNPERTFLEKIFLLHEEHKRPKEKMVIKGKSRHFYDIYKISKTEYADEAVTNKELYKSIVAHREKFTKISGIDYALHFPPNLKPIPPQELIQEWEWDYANLQEQMIVGEVVTFENLLKNIELVCEKIDNAWLNPTPKSS